MRAVMDGAGHRRRGLIAVGVVAASLMAGCARPPQPPTVLDGGGNAAGMPAGAVTAAFTRVTADTWEAEVVSSGRPVLVDAYADWCGPCKMLEPELERVHQRLGDKLKIVKLNTDEQQALASQLGVSGIPHLLLFKDGQFVDQWVGYRNSAQLLQELSPHLAS